MTIRHCIATLLLEIREIIGFEFADDPYSSVAKAWEIEAINGGSSHDHVTLGLVYVFGRGIRISLSCRITCPENYYSAFLNMPIDGVDIDDNVDEREFVKFKHIAVNAVLTMKLMMGQVEGEWTLKPRDTEAEESLTEKTAESGWGTELFLLSLDD